MLEMTPDDILTRDWYELDPDDLPFYIYEIAEDDVTLYVGKSINPFSRIVEHFGHTSRGNQRIQTIHSAYPDIVTRWKVRFYTLLDCEDITGEHFKAVKSAESAMIRKLHPCLNGTYNDDGSALPEKYRDVFLNLDNNAVDYLREL